jgi:hypothetical protein
MQILSVTGGEVPVSFCNTLPADRAKVNNSRLQLDVAIHLCGWAPEIH